VGVHEALSAIDRSRFTPVLISGGFRALAERVQRDFDVHHAFAACDYYFGQEGILESFNLLPCDFEGKLDFIRLMLNEFRLDESLWVFVGDGANDVPIASQAPMSVGFRPDPALEEVVDVVIESFSDLPAVLEKLELGDA
jgi:phosphoserine phosphatase